MENIIYNEGRVQKNKYFKWKVVKIDVNEKGEKLNNTNSEGTQTSSDVITTKVTNEYFNVTFTLQTFEMIFSKSFKYIEIIAETNCDLELFEIISVRINAENTTEALQQMLGFEIAEELPTKYFIDPINKLVYIKSAFHVSKVVYSNEITLMIRIKNISGKEGYYFKLKKAEFQRQDQFKNQTSCSVDSFTCKNTVCQILPEHFVQGVSPWEKPECAAVCGICHTGYYCNEHGQCIEIQSLNTRSSAKLVWIAIMISLFFLIV